MREKTSLVIRGFGRNSRVNRKALQVFFGHNKTMEEADMNDQNDQRTSMRPRQRTTLVVLALALAVTAATLPVLSQSIDRNQNPNIANAGIAKTLPQEIGAGRGDVMTPDSSAFIIA